MCVRSTMEFSPKRSPTKFLLLIFIFGGLAQNTPYPLAQNLIMTSLLRYFNEKFIYSAYNKSQQFLCSAKFYWKKSYCAKCIEVFRFYWTIHELKAFLLCWKGSSICKIRFAILSCPAGFLIYHEFFELTNKRILNRSKYIELL